MRTTVLAAGMALALSLPVHAQVERQHGSHEHGRSDLQLAYAEGRLELELTAPGSDIVGFEHAPGDATQQQAIDAALATLGNASAWLVVEPAGACVFEDGKAHTHGFKATRSDNADEAGHAGHDHDDDHEGHDHSGHDHGDHEGGHGEFHAELNAACSQPPSVIRADLRTHFPGADRIRVDFINEDQQGRVDLDGGRGVIELAR